MSGVEIVVFGSCFLDYIAYGDRIPNPGETLTSHSFQKGFGGKGANQAVAAARLLAENDKKISVAMAGCVGSDGDGKDYIANLKSAGCDVSKMRQLDNQSTGIALISVDKNGRNAIMICPNAAGQTGFVNGQSTAGGVFGAYSLFNNIDKRGVFICQNEIPLPSTLESLKAAFQTKRYYTVFNPAPAPSTKEQIQQILPYLKYINLICPNEHEAFLMTGVKVTDTKSAGEAITVLQKQFGARDVIITMGSQGCAVVGEHNETDPYQTGPEKNAVMIPTVKVKAIDTTGAGDCFVGSLAYFLASFLSSSSTLFIPEKVLFDCCRRACAIAGSSVTRKGTQSSYAKRSQLPQELFNNNNASKL